MSALGHASRFLLLFVLDDGPEALKGVLKGFLKGIGEESILRCVEGAHGVDEGVPPRSTRRRDVSVNVDDGPDCLRGVIGGVVVGRSAT